MQLFNGEFNISFHRCKKDQCDRCVQWQVMEATGQLTVSERTRRDEHILMKTVTRQQRASDMADATSNTLLVSFDLENMFALPRMSASSAYYRRKLNTYNMMALVHKNKQAYCAVWSENVGGRSGNEIASAVIVLLKHILLDHLEYEQLLLWSDSSVPQNRNSHISYALQHLIASSKQLQS